MSDIGPTDGQQNEEDKDRRRKGWWIFDRWGNSFKFLAVLLALTLVGGGAWLIGSNNTKGKTVYIEEPNAIGPDPFMTSGMKIDPALPIPSPAAKASGTNKPGLYGGSGSNLVCDPAAIVKFLQTHPAKAKAWVGALNNDPTLFWSGGNHLNVSDIATYIFELTPTKLTVDTAVLNHGYKNGKATPRISILKKGTAVLVDAHGDPRSRCKCGNPLGHEGDETPPPSPSPSITPSPSLSKSPSPSPSTSPTITVDCNKIPDVAGRATDVTTAPVDFNGDGTPDVLRVYQVAGVWHVRAEIGGVAVDDDVLAGIGPMTAIGGATVNNDTKEESWVKTGTSAATDIIGVLVYKPCNLQRVELNGNPAEFPVGATATAADGVSCFGFNIGIEVFTSTSSDGVTYTGTSTIYTINLSTTPPSLVAGATANQSETTSNPGWNSMHKFNCDNLNTIP